MRNLIFGLIIGMVIAGSAGIGYAWSSGPPHPNVIYSFDPNCNDLGTPDGDNCSEVAVFDDKGNKCYIAYGIESGDNPESMSCVKDNP